MTVVAARATEPETDPLSPIRQRRFSVAEYHRMIDTGILGEDEHVELLEGEVVEMSPQEKPHARATVRLNRLFSRALPDEYSVRPQMPLTLADSEPEPDLAIVRASDESEAARHPESALLVVEVADSSTRRDLQLKTRIYAKAGIPEYWLVLVKQRAIAVLRDPDPASAEYRTQFMVSSDATVAPVAFAGPVVNVGALFD